MALDPGRHHRLGRRHRDLSVARRHGLVLLYIIAFWAIVAGVFQIVAAIRFRKEIQNEWLHGLSGLVSLLFGLMLLIQPGAGALALVWVIGIYAVFFGILLLALAWRLKRHAA